MCYSNLCIIFSIPLDKISPSWDKFVICGMIFLYRNIDQYWQKLETHEQGFWKQNQKRKKALYEKNTYGVENILIVG
jgi:hypothetical protein